MEYVVTGGAGYIGGHLVDRLVNEGKKVTVLDDLSTGKYINKKSNFIKYDLRERNDLAETSDLCVIHLAANPDVRESMSNIKDSFERNVTGTFNALELARKNDAKMFLFTSTSVVYKETFDKPVPEDYEIHPVSNYALFKILGEEMIRAYSHNYGLKSVVLRFGNVTGGRVTHGVVKNWADMVKAKKPIEIWGDGTQKRSYVYYTDVLDAIMLSIQKSKEQFDIFNVTGKGGITVKEVKEILLDQLNGKLNAVHIPRKEGDMDCMVLDASKITKKIGWKAKFTSNEAVAQAFKDVIPSDLRNRN